MVSYCILIFILLIISDDESFFTRLLAIGISFSGNVYLLFASILFDVLFLSLIKPSDAQRPSINDLTLGSKLGTPAFKACAKSLLSCFFDSCCLIFFLLSFVIALYIWGISLLSDVWALNIFCLVLHFLQCWNFLGWCRPIYLFLICCLCHYSWITEDTTEASAWRMFSSVIYGLKSDNKFHNTFWISFSVTAT